MSDSSRHRRPRLAYPFTVVCTAGMVRLVAGEDHRYTFSAPNLDTWLPAFLGRCDGSMSLERLLATLLPEIRNAAETLVRQMFGERLLVDGPASTAHVAAELVLEVEGRGVLAERLKTLAQSRPRSEKGRLVLLCQDVLDWKAALDAGVRCRRESVPLLWISYAALSRAYVSPLFLPDAGPCFGCLFRSFRRLSPAPEIYDALVEHARGDVSFAPAPWPDAALMLLQGLTLWKAALTQELQAPAALYRLHVVDCATLDVSSQRVFKDPECPWCEKNPSPSATG